jgi:hypothetical protein
MLPSGKSMRQLPHCLHNTPGDEVMIAVEITVTEALVKIA